MRMKPALLFFVAFGMACCWTFTSKGESLSEPGGGTVETGLASGFHMPALDPAMPKAWTPVSFIFITKEDCEGMPGCVANNPFNTYGSIAVPVDPKAHDRVCTKQDLFDGTCTSCFPMSGEDAIVFGGWTISDARYINFLINQVDRWDGEEGRESTRSSIGLGFNTLTLKTFEGYPLNARFIMIVTASTTTAQAIKNYFINMGIPSSGINVYLFHRDFANGYMGENADNLLFMYRVCGVDEEVMARYAEYPPLMAWIIRRDPSTIGDVVEMEPWVARPDPVELGQEEDLRTLIREIITQYWPEYGPPFRHVREILRHADPEECRGEVPRPERCNYDNPDALYFRFMLSETDFLAPYFDDEEDFIIIAGVNHGLYPIQSWFSYFLYRLSDGRAFVGIQDVDMIGSAQLYWPEAGDHFFAYKLALNCHGDPWCYDVSTGEQGIEPGERFLLDGRIYLDPISKTGPDPGNFVPSIALWYQNE